MNPWIGRAAATVAALAIGVGIYAAVNPAPVAGHAYPVPGQQVTQTTRQVPPAPNMKQIGEGVFVDMAHEHGWWIGQSDAVILQNGREICRYYDRGLDFFTVVALVQGMDLDQGEAAGATGAAVGSLCQEHMGVVGK